ncbi:MAG TPA: GYF domain-containing protein, partial [Polyangiaceae bacterium]
SFPEVEEEERTRIADVGALAGAFSLAVGGTSDAAPDSLSMPADEWFVGINGVPVGPIRLSELRSKAASGSVNRDSLVWRDGFEDWRPLGTFPELSAIVDESVSSARAALTPFTPAVSAAVGAVSSATDAVVVPAVARTEVEPYTGSGNGVTAAAVVTDELVAAGVPKRSGTSPAAWIAVAIALMFGLTIGFVLFNKGNKTVEVVKYVDRVVPGAASGAVAAPGASVVVSDESNPTPDAKNQTKRVAAPAKSAGAAPSAEPDKGGIAGLKNLQAPGGLGPARGPDSVGPSGAVTGTGQLDGAQIQKTVSNYTGSVKRACWQPALDTRDKDAPTTARVNVAITVMPSGSVSNAVVNGDPKGYRGLSQCIASRVRGWQFPPSGETTTVNVPFVFAAQ